MLIELKSQLEIIGGDAELINEIKSHLDKPNPDFAKMKRMGYPTHTISPRIRMYDIQDKRLFCPRCSLSLVRQLCKKYNEKLVIKDNRTTTKPIDVRLKDLDPFWYQNEAVDVMVQSQSGIVVAPCGAGKTAIGLMFIAQLKKPTLILVHTLELFKQWEDMIQKYLVVPGKVGKIGSGRKSLGYITIAMIQTLVKLPDKDWEAINEKFEIFLGDEAHHFGADSYMKIMKRNSAKYSLGLTATPNRRDKKDFIVQN